MLSKYCLQKYYGCITSIVNYGKSMTQQLQHHEYMFVLESITSKSCSICVVYLMGTSG